MATAAVESADEPGNSGTQLGASRGDLERFCYDDALVRQFALASLLWGAVAMLVGLLVGTLLVLPRLFYPLEGLSDLLAFGRLRPLHTHAAVYAFLGNAVFAAVYYTTERLCKCRMWSGALGRLHFWGWQAMVAAAAVTVPQGMTQGRPLAEAPWLVDLLMAATWTCFGVNFLMTLVARRQRRLYITLWFTIASVVAVAAVQVLNHLIVPHRWLESYPIFAGVPEALQQAWYRHNLQLFLVGMPMLGLMYYLVPQVAQRPLYSYRLAIVHFWALALLAAAAAPGLLHYTTIPEGVSSFAMLAGLLLWSASWAGVLNGWRTLRGPAPTVAEAVRSADPVGWFLIAALACYAVVVGEGVLLSLKGITAWAAYLDWMVARTHLEGLGWYGMLIFGMLYWLAPRLLHVPLWSVRLVRWHFGLAVAGIVLYVLPIYAAGLRQGWMLWSLDDRGRLVYPNIAFLETVEAIVPMWWLRIVGGTIYLAGAVLLLVNYWMTWKSCRGPLEDSADTAPPAEACPVILPPPRRSELEDAPVLELGKKLAVGVRCEWHRAWEYHAGCFAIPVLLVVVVTGLLQLAPAALRQQRTAAGIESVLIRPYTPLELAGRELYIREGCQNCHTQIVRPLVAETQRYGEYSRAEEARYDRPTQWGLRRIGPDLARLGGRHPSAWLWAHLEDPQQNSPGSVMPSYEHLLGEPLDFEALPELVESIDRLDGLAQPRQDVVAGARRQAEEVTAEIVSQGGPVWYGDSLVLDTQAVALIAYLQRLGTDWLRTDEPAEAAETPGEESPAEELAAEDAF